MSLVLRSLPLRCNSLSRAARRVSIVKKIPSAALKRAKASHLLASLLYQQHVAARLIQRGNAACCIPASSAKVICQWATLSRTLTRPLNVGDRSRDVHATSYVRQWTSVSRHNTTHVTVTDRGRGRSRGTGRCPDGRGDVLDAMPIVESHLAPAA